MQRENSAAPLEASSGVQAGSAAGSGAGSLKSFDVFDTVLTRLVGEPRSLFLLLGHQARAQGHWLGTAAHFAANRAWAEDGARALAHPAEVSLAEIYEFFCLGLSLPPTQGQALAALELALERRLLRAVPATLDQLDSLRRQGLRLCFVSDMYLPQVELARWLFELVGARPEETVWVSCEHRATKASGALFELVRADSRQTLSDWLHTGDNHYADVHVPIQYGLQAHHLRDCHLNAHEQLLERYTPQTEGLSALMAGAARWSRLNAPAGADPALEEMASGVAAPLIYAFVLWLLQQAQAKGIKRLWFMARDGQVMLPVARAIAAQLNMDLELGYLYGGRQIVRVASLQQVDDVALDWMTGGAGIMELQSVLDRVGLSLAQVQRAATAVGLPLSGVIGWDRMPSLRRFLQAQDVAPLILAEAARRRAVVLDYLAECGLLGDSACGVVDIGWQGNVLKSMVDLLGLPQLKRHHFFYFGLYGRPRGCEGVPMVGYLFDHQAFEPTANTQLRGSMAPHRFGVGADIPSITTLMEIFCQADHGPVMQLRRTPDGFAPVHGTEALPQDAHRRWQVPAAQAAIQRFADALPLSEAPDLGVNLRPVCDALLRRVACEPTEAEVALLSGIGFVDDQGGAAAQRFARAYRWTDLRIAFRHGQTWPRLGLNWWVAGAKHLTPPAMRWAMRVCAKLGRWRLAWRARNRTVA